MMAVSAVRLDSDPICSSAGCVQFLHPAGITGPPPPAYDIDYFVPNLGKDADMIHTESHIAQTEEQMGHTWTPTIDAGVAAGALAPEPGNTKLSVG